MLEPFVYQSVNTYDHHDLSLYQLFKNSQEATDTATDARAQRISVAILGIPFDESVRGRKGSHLAPNSIREQFRAIQSREMRSKKFKLYDFGNIVFDFCKASPEQQEEHTLHIKASHEKIRDEVYAIAKRSDCVISLGGDHSISFPCIQAIWKAAERPNIGLINIDAHLDLRETIEGTISSGTSFRFLIESQIVKGSNLFEIAIRERANSSYYLDYAKSKGIHVVDMESIYLQGLPNLLKESIIPHLSTQVDAVYLSIDMDALDQAFAPGVSATNPQGLSPSDLVYLISTICEELPLIGLDIVETNPHFDIDNITSKRAALCITHAIDSLYKRLH